MFFIAFIMINELLASERQWKSFVAEAKSSQLVAEQIVRKAPNWQFAHW